MVPRPTDVEGEIVCMLEYALDQAAAGDAGKVEIDVYMVSVLREQIHRYWEKKNAPVAE